MELYLLRHGLAVEPDTHHLAKDAERPLTSKGERKLWQIAEAVEALHVSWELILSSPYVRARQTAEIVAEAFNAREQLEFSEQLTPGGSPRKLIEYLNGFDPGLQSVLLVGHEPYLSELISWLVSGDAGFPVTLKKGGLCKLEAERLQYGRCATLEWLLTPKQMLLMAGG